MFEEGAEWWLIDEKVGSTCAASEGNFVATEDVGSAEMTVEFSLGFDYLWVESLLLCISNWIVFSYIIF